MYMYARMVHARGLLVFFNAMQVGTIRGNPSEMDARLGNREEWRGVVLVGD